METMEATEAGIILGFSGTRHGMSPHQRDQFIEWVRENKELITEFHHGMCVGADANAHTIIRDLCQTGQPGPQVPIHGHPGCVESHPARGVLDKEVDVLHGLAPFIERNHDIVDASNVILFAPKFPETRRSGTWATFRYARKRGKNVVMLAQFKGPEL